MNSGTVMLRQMAAARRFNRWMADQIAPLVRGSVLEIGAGIGNLTEFLMPCADRYVAMDTEPEHLAELARRFNVQAVLCDAADARSFDSFRNCFDTVVCLNVLEHIPDDCTTLANIRDALHPAGTAIVLVPQCQAVFGALDEVLGHERRYSKTELVAKMTAAGFRLEHVIEFNRATLPGWFLNSRILRRRTLSSVQLRIFDFLVPLWRKLDRFWPWPATSLIAIGKREQ
jgi:2-polyprenyl-3-methyl-5-hydroxy-6-metoxy-1,4-benzoquinol methylase